jgi:polyphenol oxidase
MSWTLDRSRAVPAWLPEPARPFFALAFSTRCGGISAPPFDTLDLGFAPGDRPEAVTENRRRFLCSLDLDPGRFVTAGQVHGTRIERVTAPGHVPACDALLTVVPGLALAVATADCVPLLYCAPGAVAAAHAGWRGAAAGLPALALAAVCEAAAVPPGEVRVAIGPCIRACCYPVGIEVAERFPAAARTRDGDVWRVDLPAAIRLQLAAAGLPADALEDTGACTACHPADSFSHRRDQGRTGRLWGVAALRLEGGAGGVGL